MQQRAPATPFAAASLHHHVLRLHQCGAGAGGLLRRAHAAALVSGALAASLPLAGALLLSYAAPPDPDLASARRLLRAHPLRSSLSSPVPIPMPFPKLQHVVRRFERPAVQEGFFTFSAASVKKLKATANDEMRGAATASGHLGTISYVGNAGARGTAESTAGEVERNGLGWTAWLLNRAVASFGEARVRGFLDGWARAPEFVYLGSLLSAGGEALFTGSSPRFDVFGNDLGWGRPAAVRSGSADKMDGKATVFEEPEKGESISVEVCLAREALARLVADVEFMDAVSVPA
ncbi:hypothetical protein ACP4OV_003448 [Aristida adscensionis]